MDLATYVRSNGREQTAVDGIALSAATMVAKRIGTSSVPDAVLSQAILAVGANLYQKRASSIGTAGYGDPELTGNPMRPALDPMTQAWPLLTPYLGAAIA